MLRRCLIIEDDDLMRGMLRDALEDRYELVLEAEGRSAWEKFQKESFDVVISDLKLPGMDGLELLKRIKERQPETIFILITGYGTVENAVQAMKLGAFDYLTKPFLSEELIQVLDKALEMRSLRIENQLLKEQLTRRTGFDKIISKSKSMQDILQTLQTVAPTPSTVLIQGESGTGKELIAEALHHFSDRRDRPLVKVSCAALPENLLESELFGHEKGAFTDARKQKIGRFEMANRGTLFLDDVDDIHPGIQVKLLRVLQERELVRVGGTATLKMDVRLIAATKVDLKKKIQDGTFRDDLFYRLNVVPVNLPPLRERREDIPPLIRHFEKKFCRQCRKDTRFTQEIINILMACHWPGNIRELENLVERLVTLSTGQTITLTELPPDLREAEAWQPRPLKEAVSRAESEHIRRVLKLTQGHKREAARILGITPKSLWQKLKKFESV